MVRVKRRCVVVLVECPKKQNKFSESEIASEIRNQIEQLFGDFGVACLSRGFSIKRYDPNDGHMIVMVRKGVHDMLMASLPLISNINDKPCRLGIKFLSGTVRSSLKYIYRDHLAVLRLQIGRRLSLH